MVSDGPREPNEESPPPPTPPNPLEPTQADQGPDDADLGQTMERPPADPWAEETEIRPPLLDLPPSDYPPAGLPPGGPPGGPPGEGRGPSGTGVLPTVPEEPRWSARAQVRPPDVDRHEAEEEWAEPGRSPMVPILIAVGVLVLIGLIVLGAALLLNNKDEPTGTTPTLTPPATSAASTPAVTSAATTSAAPATTGPTLVPIPEVKGLDYTAAAAKLTAAGFVPNRRDEVSGQQPAGKVVGTDPPVGLTVLTGTKIDIIVSKGLPNTSPTPRPTTATPGPTRT